MKDAKSLPLLVVLPRKNDVSKVKGGGSKKYLCEVTPELREHLAERFEGLLEHFEEQFRQFPSTPCVGKVKMKEKAIAKSHKPERLLNSNNCPIIGVGKLDEIYIKVTPDGIRRTIDEIRTSSIEDIKVNLSKIEDVEPYSFNDDAVDGSIIDEPPPVLKVKLFDFRNRFDNDNVARDFHRFLESRGLLASTKLISYCKNLTLFRIENNTPSLLVALSQFNAVKSVSSFPRFFSAETQPSLKHDGNLVPVAIPQANVTYPIIGIIDSGIKPGHPFLQPWIHDRVEYVPPAYQNSTHGTFVAGVINYGNQLNSFQGSDRKYKILDVVALPNGDPQYGPTDSVSEDQFIMILEDVLQKYSQHVKIWNLSLGTNAVCDTDHISDFAVAIDHLQDKYGVNIVISSGNYNTLPLRTWPPNAVVPYDDRITVPSDSVRSITVGSVAHLKGNGCVEIHEPSPFSRRGPGPNFIVKPELVDYGGNCDTDGTYAGCGVMSFSESGSVCEAIGTSFSTPRVTGLFATLASSLKAQNTNIAKALLIHSATNPLNCDIKDKSLFHYLGYGRPNHAEKEILLCNDHEMVMIFDNVITLGTYISIDDFPYPKSLLKGGKWFGEIRMSLVYNPPIDASFGQEYCRSNIDVSFGTYMFSPKKNKLEYDSKVPLQSRWSEKFEKERVENGFKWAPIKSYYRNIKNGVEGLNWRLLIECTARHGEAIATQPFTLIISIKDPDGSADVYSDSKRMLVERGFMFHDLQVQERVRQSL